ncbi:peptide deformylase [Candidatus Finniella inopinata]|uniref:Peptide deformylase n=1 Tax=Candidatus Finniella inopinata TaxID=1696036 RepID=A0A4Q7DKE1_9PROT|nr:peptide deformylase [Candidatus Finniella inopinata]RZI46848.1 peptide deformylase [Candidatus Finniella inopinata]
MARLTVLTVPDARLRVKAVPILGVDDNIRQLMDDMLETMYAEDGAGLAATQVGINKRVVVLDLEDHAPGLGPLKIANPEIVWRSEDVQKNWEACLSVPGQSAQVERHTAIRLKYLDENNTTQEKDFVDWVSVCLQHEIDHLQGVLYVDHLSALRRNLLIEKAKKFKAS